jgi:hypothetical protein
MRQVGQISCLLVEGRLRFDVRTVTVFVSTVRWRNEQPQHSDLRERRNPYGTHLGVPSTVPRGQALMTLAPSSWRKPRRPWSKIRVNGQLKIHDGLCFANLGAIHPGHLVGVVYPDIGCGNEPLGYDEVSVEGVPFSQCERSSFDLVREVRVSNRRRDLEALPIELPPPPAAQ